MIKLKINPNALTKKYKIIFIFLMFFTGCIASYSVASVYYNYPDEKKLENSHSNTWVDKKNINGVYDLKKRIQVINIKNTTNLHFTSACNYSHSMMPTIMSDSILVYIVPENPHVFENIKIGDIIIFKQDGDLICHRIDGYVQTTNERAYWTKGDNNKERDEKPIYEKDIVGIIVGIFY